MTGSARVDAAKERVADACRRLSDALARKSEDLRAEIAEAGARRDGDAA